MINSSIYDDLWPGTRFLPASSGFPLGTDSVLLADFAHGSGKIRRVADLGCGAGVLTVLLLQKFPASTAFGVEIQTEAAEACRENLALNALSDRAEIRCGDLREKADLPEAGSYDLVVSNPPYFAAGSGYTAPEAHRAAARDERFCTLEDVCRAAAYLCRWGGSFAVVHRPERLSELLCAMTASGVEPKRLRLVCPRAERAPSLILVEGRRGGKPGLTIEPPLVLQDEAGADSEEIQRIYHMENQS